jgi:hypothetical protein
MYIKEMRLEGVGGSYLTENVVMKLLSLAE